MEMVWHEDVNGAMTAMLLEGFLARGLGSRENCRVQQRWVSRSRINREGAHDLAAISVNRQPMRSFPDRDHARIFLFLNVAATFRLRAAVRVSIPPESGL